MSEKQNNAHDNDQMKDHELSRADLMKMEQTGESGWGKLDYAGEQKRDKIAESLKKFEDATGLPQKRRIGKIKKVRDGRELHETEEEMKSSAKKWYRGKLAESGLFEPMDDSEREFINFEHKSLLSRFDKLSLADNDMNMTTVLSTIDQDLVPRRRFRNKLVMLKEQNPLVFKEYMALLPTLGLVGSKEALLGKVMVAMKPVMNMPEAVQKAFKERRNTLGTKKETGPLVAEVSKEYKDKVEDHNKMLDLNVKYFGGKDINGQPETLVEFKDHFGKLESFGEMDATMKALPNLIAKRKALYEKSQALIQKAKPEMQEKLKTMVKEMRRHQLESYMDTLESAVTNDNMNIADAGNSLLKEVDGVALFSKFEIENETRKMQKMSLNGQPGQVESLKLEIEEREKVVQEYQKLPDKMRDDETFMDANSQDRSRMLKEAKDAKLTSHDNPFDLAANNDEGYLDDLGDELESSDGGKMLDEYIDESEMEGETEAADLINLTRKRVGLKDDMMKMHNESQQEVYKRDFKKWIRLDEGAEEEKDVHTAREKTKVKAAKEADLAWEKGFTFNSAMIATQRQDVDARELRRGDSKARERVKRARYGLEINIQKEDGTDQERNVGKMLDDLSEEQKEILIKRVMEMLLGNMKISAGKSAVVKNSGTMKEKVGKRLMKREYFSNLKKQAA